MLQFHPSAEAFAGGAAANAMLWDQYAEASGCRRTRCSCRPRRWDPVPSGVIRSEPRLSRRRSQHPRVGSRLHIQVENTPTDLLAAYWVQGYGNAAKRARTSLVDALRRLPPDTAIELSALVERLADLAPNHRIDWSDSWSDEDLKEFRAASLRRLEAEESEDKD